MAPASFSPKANVNTLKGNPNLTAEEIEGFKEELQNLSNLIDDISEKSGRPTSLRENRRNLQKSLRPVSKLVIASDWSLISAFLLVRWKPI